MTELELRATDDGVNDSYLGAETGEGCDTGLAYPDTGE